MKVSYNKLWKKLIDMNMNKGQLQGKCGLSPTTLAKMGKNENVSMDVLKRICDYLKCDVGDIISFEKEEVKNTESKEKKNGRIL